jgi:cell division protein FtsQ
MSGEPAPGIEHEGSPEVSAEQEVVATTEPGPTTQVTATPEPGLTTEPVATHELVATTAREGAHRSAGRPVPPWALIAAALIVLVGLAAVLTFTPIFAAKRVLVSGTHHVRRGAVLRMAGVGLGTNVLHADLGAITRRLEADPWIADAVVTRSLPTTLSILIVERVPVGIAPDAGGTLDLVAADGTRLGRAQASTHLPTITPTFGEQAPTASAIRGAAAVLASMPGSLRAAVATIAVASDGFALVQTRSGVTVTYGDGSQLEAKAQALAAVLAWATSQAKTLATVDVTVPGAPTARLAGGAPAPVPAPSPVVKPGVTPGAVPSDVVSPSK